MGWWYVEGTRALVGDAPLETLRDALADISAQYEKALKRRPSKAEWEALFAAGLSSGEGEGDQKLLDKGAVKKVTIDAG